jgi:hypothetical protein
MKTHESLRARIDALGISQGTAARLLGISTRQMRSYLADPDQASTAIEAPAYVRLALEGLRALAAQTEIETTLGALADAYGVVGEDLFPDFDPEHPVTLSRVTDQDGDTRWTISSGGWSLADEDWAPRDDAHALEVATALMA